MEVVEEVLEEALEMAEEQQGGKADSDEAADRDQVEQVVAARVARWGDTMVRGTAVASMAARLGGGESNIRWEFLAMAGWAPAAV